jgi:hypothetical protein
MVKRSRDTSVASSSTADNKESTSAESDSPRPTKFNAADIVEVDTSMSTIQCSLPPHKECLTFPSIEKFELHYAKDHSNRCVSCGKNFPTAHLLALHGDEHHNPFREALQEQGEKTYGCFVEGCEKKCSTPQKRRLHLIDKHLFPKVYNFKIVETGIDRSVSMLQEGRRRRVSTTTDQAGSQRRWESKTDSFSKNQSSSAQSLVKEVTEPISTGADSNTNVSDGMVHDLEQSMSALRFVPPSVTNKRRGQ